MATNDSIFVLTKAGQELEVKLDDEFEYVLFLDDRNQAVMKIDVDFIDRQMLAGAFDPGTVSTIEDFVGFRED